MKLMTGWRFGVAVFACGAEWSAAEPLCAIDVRRAPDAAWTVSDGQTNALSASGPHAWSNAEAHLEMIAAESGTRVRVGAPDAPLEAVILRWSGRMPVSTKLLGDAWERSYGE